jgi:hypothetical protein
MVEDTLFTGSGWFGSVTMAAPRHGLLREGEHSAYHTMGWTRRTEDFIALEKALGREYSPIEILRFGVSLRRYYGLKGMKIVPYED